MKQKITKVKQTFLIIGAAVTWFAILVQLYLIILNRVESVPETIIRFFSFYTILTNILVAFCFTVLLVKPNSRSGIFFSQASILNAITIYIFVVGLLYNLILRQIWSPVGLQRLADELLHVVIPLLFILYWYLFAPKDGLRWKNAFPWLLYPFVYAVFVLFRGALSGFYPYPFVDANILGLKKVLLNSVGLFIGFFLISLLFIAIAKAMSKKNSST
ncbi:Pr6Pr family membrane protein [Flavobacterium sp. DSP2-3-1]|uniref:Pr6Pr family membrane protein n=1 Tax=Flavobacterium sp. DSP2-3-1 TaxID=2804620 RepID=UPI003CFA5216